MHFLRQFLALLQLNLASITARLGAVLTILVGVTCAVGVLVSMLAMSSGVRRQALADVRDDRASLGSPGARFGMGSVTRDQANTARDLPYLAKGADGRPVLLLESLVPIQARRRDSGARIYFPLIGVSPNLSAYRPELRLTAGRMFRPGLHELIASRSCSQFAGFELNDKRSLHGSDWIIVGRFVLGHVQQCIVYADVETLMTTFSRETYSRLSVRLESGARYGAFARAVADNPALKLEAHSERELIELQMKDFTGLLKFIAVFVGSIMAIGATLGAINSLYAVVDARRRELATLRAIGFGSGPILASVLCESVLLALPGALLGGALAWLFFNHMAASPFGFSFELDVTAGLVALGIEWALVMGFIGGLLPGLRAARIPITAALRAT